MYNFVRKQRKENRGPWGILCMNDIIEEGNNGKGALEKTIQQISEKRAMEKGAVR